MDIAHNRAKIGMPHNCGQRKRINLLLGGHPCAKRVAQIVEHKRNVSATAYRSEGKSRGPLVSLRGFKIWNDSSVRSTVRPAAFVFAATTVKVRAFSLNCSFRARVISSGRKP
jgi:hypothetical protein